MSSTRRITTILRATAVAGLISAATVGLAGTANIAHAHPPMHVVSASVSAFPGGVRLAADEYDDDSSTDEPSYADMGSDTESGWDAEPQQDQAAPDEQPADAEQPDDTDVEPEAPEPAQVDAQPAPDAPASPETDDAPQPAPTDEPAATPDVDITEASQTDIATAQAADPVTVNPAPAPAADVAQISGLISSEITSAATVTGTMWNREVAQWNSSWVTYDTNFRPIIANPYRLPLQLVYTYDNAPRIITVAPLQRVVFDVPNSGVYDFTALLRSPAGAIANVAVGSFTGGGYVPTAGQPRPAQPAAPPSFANALVQIRYANGTSAPFRVKKLTDLGDDSVAHAHRVLIDDATSAWGQWTKNPSGERRFNITETLQLPGLGSPTQAPLPGYTNVHLVTKPAPMASNGNH